MRTPLLLAALSLGVGARTHTPEQTRSGDDLLARSAAMYAALRSYADAGTVKYEYPGVTDSYRFRTYFRRETHDLFFEWQGVTSYTPAVHFTSDISVHHTVIWMLHNDMQKYDAETHVLDRYPPGSNQTSALSVATSYTRGVSTLIPSMLYSKTNLVSTLKAMEQIRDDGVELIDGQQTHRLVGVAADRYGATGRTVNVRQVTVWVDTSSLLIRRLVEESPKGTAPDSYRRTTISIRPEANPTLEDGKFQFTVPSK